MSAAVANIDSWRAAAACIGSSIDFFSDDEFTMARAITVCQKCPVREICLKEGRGEEHGVWGGTTPRQRGIRERRQEDSCLSCGGQLIGINETRDRCLSCDSVWYR